MKKLLAGLAFSAVLIPFLALPAEAHRSGCHSWHSCPSDTGSYTCGDKGYCSSCSDNQYCKNGAYSPIATRPKPAATPKPVTVTKPPTSFVGTPKTQAQLMNCLVVGNGASKIYHLKGSQWIKQMNLKDKTCFATEAAAKIKGYRKSKT